MNIPLFAIVLGVLTLYFSVQILRLLPFFLLLFSVLRSGAAKWPGPIAEYPPPKARFNRRHLATRNEHLFSTFVGFSLGVLGAFVFTISVFLNELPQFTGLFVSNSLLIPTATGVIVVSGKLSMNRLVHNMAQLKELASGARGTSEPRRVVGQTAENKYAIDHPLIGPGTPRSNGDRALHIYRDSLTNLQAGNRLVADNLYQQAINLDSSLHDRAHNRLMDLAYKREKTEYAGSVYYWLGIHSEYLGNIEEAKEWYQRAAGAFAMIGHIKQQGRAYSNMGTALNKMGDSEAALRIFETAILLNDKDGIAHINIGLLYYRSSNDKGHNYELALDAFANAILADPETYGPMVQSYMSSYAYEWQKDLNEVIKRVEERRR